MSSKPTVMQNRPKTAVKHIKPRTGQFLQYEKRIEKMKNAQGGGALVNGTLFDFRKVMKEIVDGYP